MTAFAAAISAAYATEGEAVDLGRAVHEGELVREAAVRVPLATMNRHGLVAGATGGADAIGDFLRSREGKALQKKVARGIFGMLKKRL
jgi:hypothetical protein